MMVDGKVCRDVDITLFASIKAGQANRRFRTKTRIIMNQYQIESIYCSSRDVLIGNLTALLL